MVKEPAFSNKYDLSKIAYFSFFTAVLLTAFVLYFINKPSFFVMLMLTPIALVLLVNINRYYLYYFTAGLFLNITVNLYGPLSFLLINLTAYIVILVFLFRLNTDSLNVLKLPKSFKFASIFFIFSVFLSSVNTTHRSFQSLYFFFLFLVYIFTGYLVFRSVKDNLTVEKFFNFYFICMLITCMIIIFQIIITSKIRSVGLMDYSIMDFSAITLTILILKYFIMGKVNLKVISISLITLTVLITTQSRFAWLGFTLSLIYGIIIVYKYDLIGKKLLRKRTFMVALLIVIITVAAISSGVSDFISKRFSDVTFEFFDSSESGPLIQNSLETRALIWLTALQAFQSSPVTGIGYQMFSFVSENYNILPSILYENFVEGLDPHNTMLAFLTETGILGLCAFLTFIISIFVYSFKSIKISTDRSTRINSIILNVIIFFILINSVFSGQYTMRLQAFFMFIFLGLSAGNYAFLKSMSQKNPKSQYIT